MAGVNKVIIVGNLGNDPEVNYGQGGSAVARISVATSDQWTDKHTGQKQERTEWHRIVFFGRLAEIAGEYLRKGSQVYVEGSLRTDKYTDKQGIEKYSTDVVAREMTMLGSRGGQGGGFQQASQPQQQGQQGQSPASQDGGQQLNGGNDFDDDIPF